MLFRSRGGRIILGVDSENPLEKELSVCLPWGWGSSHPQGSKPNQGAFRVSGGGTGAVSFSQELAE